MKLRRTSAIALTLLTVGALSACATLPESAPAESAAAGGEVKTIAFDFPYTSLPVYKIVADFAQERADELGVTLQLTSDDMNLANQVSNLTAMQDSVDAMVSFPLEPASIESIAKSYLDSGKQWVTYGGDMENQSASLQFSFYDSGAALGEDAAAWAEETLGGSGKVLILTDYSITLASERSKGIVEAFGEAAPGMTVIEQPAVTTDEALSVTNAVLAQNPDLDMVLAFNDDLAQAAYQALVSSGRSETDPNTYIGGVNGTLFAFEKIKAGTIYRASAATSLKAIGYGIIDVPIAAAKSDADASLNVPVVLITKDAPEIDDYIAEYK